MSQRLSSQLGAVLLLALGFGFAGGAAAAPTEAQQSAIRASCQSDYRAHCASVSPGGAAALQCLQQNLASLSPACQSAVNAASGGVTTQGAPAQTAPAEATQPTTTQPTTTQATTTPPASGQPASGEPATPPQPTEAQLTALRSACPRDYGTYCGNVPAGGAAALQCLQQNVASLSPNCKAAVGAISPPPPPAKPTEAQLTAIRAACPRDYGTYCGDVPAGGAPALQCLQKNVASLSPSCKSAVEAVGGGPAPAAAAMAAPAQPTQAQQTAIKSACQHDYRAHCASVPPGGAAALQCLQKNAASLSPSCQKAVAAVGGGAATGMATTTTTAPATAPAAVPPEQQPVIVMSPREEMMVMRQACGPDYQAYCRGVRIMGGAALQCLMANSGRLSGGCKSALAQFERRQ